MASSSRVVPQLILAASLTAAFASGCSENEVTPETAAANVSQGQLEEVGQLYQATVANTKKAPSSLKSLASARDIFFAGYSALERGDVIAYWDVKPTPEEASATEVLAYMAAVPEKGGAVLLKNLTIKTMTAEEFAAAPKPKGATSAPQASAAK